MIPVPPSVQAKLIALVVSTAVSTVVPFLLQDRPILKWVFDKAGPRIVNKVVDKEK